MRNRCLRLTSRPRYLRRRRSQRKSLRKKLAKRTRYRKNRRWWARLTSFNFHNTYYDSIVQSNKGLWVVRYVSSLGAVAYRSIRGNCENHNEQRRWISVWPATWGFSDKRSRISSDRVPSTEPAESEDATQHEQVLTWPDALRVQQIQLSQ